VTVYDIGDMGVPRESEWTDLRRAIAGFADAANSGQTNGVADRNFVRILAASGR
jgi:dynein intermediate chain